MTIYSYARVDDCTENWYHHSNKNKIKSLHAIAVAYRPHLVPPQKRTQRYWYCTKIYGACQVHVVGEAECFDTFGPCHLLPRSTGAAYSVRGSFLKFRCIGGATPPIETAELITAVNNRPGIR